MESNSELRSMLNQLIQTCRDGQEGFRTAAENIENGEIQHVLNEYSLQRAKFTGELQGASHDLGDSNPENASSVMGALHRGLVNLKHAIVGKNLHSILTECERGENSAVEDYRRALQLKLPWDLRMIIERQSSETKEAHVQVKALRDAHAPK